MSVNPFHSVMTSRAAFDAGQRQSDVVSNLNLNDISGEPPLSQSREQNLALKVKAPPLTPTTLDLGGNTYGSGSSEVNSAGVLKSYAGIFGRSQSEPAAYSHADQQGLHDAAVKTDGGKPAETLSFSPPEFSTIKAAKTVEAARPDETQAAKRTPSLSFGEFQAIQRETGDKFANASYDLSIKHSDGGSVFRHRYTADDFTTCTLSSKDGSMSAVVTDKYARPTLQEDIGADGRSTVTRFAYNDEGGRKAMFASRKEVTDPDGTVKTFNYDRFGKVLQA